MILVKNPPANAGRCKTDRFHPWFGKIPLEEGMATQSSILAWRILWTEVPGRLQSISVTQNQTHLKWLSTQTQLYYIFYFFTYVMWKYSNIFSSQKWREYCIEHMQPYLYSIIIKKLLCSHVDMRNHVYIFMPSFKNTVLYSIMCLSHLALYLRD